MEGEDSAENLRSRVQPVADQWNSIKKKGFLQVKVQGVPRQVPVKLLCAADFQFFKAAMNMSKYTSAVWCCCPTERLYVAPDTPAQSWDDVLAFYDSVGCSLKDLETICELNHFSHEVLHGRPFKPFKCRCGYNSGSEREWRAAVEGHMQLDEAERKAADLEHSSNPLHCRHKPFAPPLFHHSTMDLSADVLHLVFINLFTSFLEFTMLVYVNEFSVDARQPFESYLRSISVPMKVVKAEGVAEMKQSLCGRDAKVLLNNTVDHLIHLLEFVSMSGEEVDEAVAGAQSSNDARANDPQKRKRGSLQDEDDDFDWECPSDEELLASESEEVEEDLDNLTRVQRDARSWDKFLQLVHAMRPFKRDDEDYRKARGVETFNAAAEVVKEYKRLNPSSKSACPHVALCVLPRQQVAHGDHHRRGTDHGEALGASIKDQLHRRTLRRRIGSQAKE
ncbi:hypothetical protein AB1Y20_000316 [Prymnesium parvum]|uniref:Uncharacterized protein n=1 Tax=Prymnesium parvum TaxID=97485 RepID=A0AB34K4J2_PRYPA